MDGEQAPLKRIAIAFLSHDRVHPGFTYDYGHLIGHFTGSGGYIPETNERFAISLNWCQTSLLAEGRQRLMEDCRTKGADKILWIDTDMRFPRQSLHMLLRHNKPIVGVNYVSRRPPFRFTAATFNEEPLETYPDSEGLAEVAHMGFGLVLTDCSIFDEDRPYFSFEWYRKEDGQWGQVGEDVYFSREMRAKGHKLFVDQELSASIGHEGDFIFTPEEMVRVEAVA